jgi:hypothetical protein
MTAVVAVLGAAIVILGLLGAASPARFRALFALISPRSRYLAAVIIRVLMAALLWWLADELRHPQVMRVLAVIAGLAAVFILLAGARRLDQTVDWWLARSDGVLRISLVFAGAFGGYLVYVAT